MTKSEDEPVDWSTRTKKGDTTEEDEADCRRVGMAHPWKTARRRNRRGRGIDAVRKEGPGRGGVGAEER